MTAALIITLRETLEASLIIGIILAYLNKTENSHHNKIIWYAVFAGIAISALLAYSFEVFVGEFEGEAEAIYEGATMILAAGLITWMILWMLKQRKTLKEKIENKVNAHIKDDHPTGLFLLVFVSVIREGIETIIFLNAASIQSKEGSIIIGGIFGILTAILISYLLFKEIKQFQTRKFFTITSIVLILFAAGLMTHAIHEFQEARILPTVIEHLWDLNPEPIITTSWMINVDKSMNVSTYYPLLHEEGAIGGILKSVFGYNGNPSLIEVISYWIYLMSIATTWRWIEKKN